jgi:hypothetical protein
MNIFLLSEGLSEEDRFTAHLHYLIECVPEVGQSLVDELLRQAGKPPARFQKSENHPGSDAQNRPDFLLRCDAFDIVCEHKLRSPLGERQLERYLAMSWPRPHRLALISNVPINVSAEVLGDARYLRPIAPHYLWRDVHAMLQQSEQRLAHDFGHYMRSLGMCPFELPNGWGTLFAANETAEVFGDQFRNVRAYFLAKGCRCTLDASRLGFQIGRLTPWLHLIYLFVEPAGSSSPKIGQAVLGARIYVPKDARERSSLRIPPTNFKCGALQVQAQSHERVAKWNKGLCCVLEYKTPLEPVLDRPVPEIADTLLEFAKDVFEHCQALVTKGSANTQV